VAWGLTCLGLWVVRKGVDYFESWTRGEALVVGPQFSCSMFLAAEGDLQVEEAGATNIDEAFK